MRLEPGFQRLIDLDASQGIGLLIDRADGRIQVMEAAGVRNLSLQVQRITVFRWQLSDTHRLNLEGNDFNIFIE